MINDNDYIDLITTTEPPNSWLTTINISVDITDI